MPGKTYNAGTIFLQVVPVFGDVQNSIRRQVNDIDQALGDGMERSGRRAGERAGKAMGEEMEKQTRIAARRNGNAMDQEYEKIVRRLSQSLDPIELRADSTKARNEVKRLRKEVLELLDHTIDLDADGDKAIAAARKVQAAIAKIEERVNIEITADDKTKVATDSVEKRLRELDEHTRIRVTAEDKTKVNLDRIKVRLQGLDEHTRIRVTAEDRTKVNLDRIRLRLEGLDEHTRIRVTAEDRTRVAVDGIMARLAAAQAAANIDITADDHTRVSTEQLFARLENLRRAARVQMHLDATPADRAMGAFEKRMRATAKKAADHLGDSFDPEIREIKAQLLALSETRIGIDMSSAEFMAKLQALEARLKQVSAQSIDIQAKIDSGKAYAELATVNAAISAVDGRDIDVRVDVDSGAAIAKMGLLKSLFSASSVGDGGASGAQQGANAFRSFNVVILAVATLLPTLVPILGAVGGALLALIPILAAVGAGIGAMLIGFSGIGDAVSALGDVNKNAAKESAAAARTMRQAAYGVADAQLALADAQRQAARAQIDAARAVADARRAAGEAIEAALDRQKDAQEAYRDSVDDVREAEQALSEARVRERERRDSTKDELRQNALSIREAALAAFDTTNTFNAVMADGSSTAYDKEAAEVAMLQARERLHELREEQKRLAEEKKEQDKDGVDGAEDVEDAQDALTEALEAQRDAQEAVGEAAEDVAKARIDGARSVARAVEAQQRAEEDGARNVARAQEALRRAQESYTDALYDTEVTGSASIRKLEEAMGKLGPAGRKFARFLFSLREGFYDFRKDIQEALLPSIEAGLLGLIIIYGPQFKAWMTGMADAMGDLFLDFAKSLNNPGWKRFFDAMGTFGESMLRSFGGATIAWFEGYAGILATVAPFAQKMADGMERMGDQFARWASSKKGQDAITRFMQYAAEVGPHVLRFFGSFARAIGALSAALAPIGLAVLDGLTAFFNWLADQDPGKIRLVVGSVLALVVAFQLAALVAVAILATGVIFATTTATIVFGVVAVIGILGVLALRFPKVRKAIEVTLRAIGRSFNWLNTHVIAPTIAWISENWPKMLNAMKKAWERDLKPALEEIGKTLLALWEGVIAPTLATIAEAWGDVFGFLVKAWEKILWPVLRDAFFPAIKFMWTKIFGPTLRRIFKAWKFMMGAMRATWRTILQPVISKIIDVIGWLWEKVIRPVLGFIIKTWTKVFKAMVTVWNNVLWPVLKVVGKIIWKLWKAYFGPAIEGIRKLWEKLSLGFKIAWDKWGQPLFDTIREKVLPKLQSAFEALVEGISKIWGGLKKVVGGPLEFIINTVIRDGLVKGFNKIANFVGEDGIKFDGVNWNLGPDAGLGTRRARGGIIGRDESRATGGVLPGYTPGHDVHHFVSPTAGRLHLSGGEAIMRPEFTAAVGSGYVDKMNAIARAGGVNGVRRAMKFATGGIYWPTTYKDLSGDYPGHTGVDISIPGTADLGKPVVATNPGTAYAFWSGTPTDPSYGNTVRIVHSDNGYESWYGHLLHPGLGGKPNARVLAGSLIGQVGTSGNSTGPHLHYEVRPGSTRAAALAYLGNAPIIGVGQIPNVGQAQGNILDAVPDWIKAVIRDPLGYVKGLVQKPVDKLKEKFGGNDMVKGVAKLPFKIVDKVKDKIVDMLPSLSSLSGGKRGPDPGAGPGEPGDGPGHAPGATGGAGADFWRGGVLPYNGTMKYDAGGYIPPGLTSVLNLTGKPEPVFTDEQFRKGAPGGGALIGTYAPVYHDAKTSEDIIDDFEFSIRKLSRSSSSKYAGSR